MKKNSAKLEKHLALAVAHTAAREGGNIALAEDIASRAKKAGIKIKKEGVKK